MSLLFDSVRVLAVIRYVLIILRYGAERSPNATLRKRPRGSRNDDEEKGRGLVRAQ